MTFEKLKNLFFKVFTTLLHLKRRDISFYSVQSDEFIELTEVTRDQWVSVNSSYSGYLYVMARKCTGIDLSCNTLSSLTGSFENEFCKAVMPIKRGGNANYLIHSNKTMDGYETAECHVYLIRSNGEI